jgi:hypothetical protein
MFEIAYINFEVFRAMIFQNKCYGPLGFETLTPIHTAFIFRIELCRVKYWLGVNLFEGCMEDGQRPKRHEKGQSSAPPSYWPRVGSNSSSLLLVLSNHTPCNMPI